MIFLTFLAVLQAVFASSSNNTSITYVPVGGDYANATFDAFVVQAIKHAHARARSAATMDTDDDVNGTVNIVVNTASYAPSPPTRIAKKTRDADIALAATRAAVLADRCARAAAPAGLQGCRVSTPPVFVRDDAEATGAHAAAALYADPDLDGVFSLGGDQDAAMQAIYDSALERAWAGARTHARTRTRGRYAP